MSDLPPPGVPGVPVRDTSRLPSGVIDAASAHAWLFSWWVPAVLAVVTVSLVVLVVRCAGRRPRHVHSVVLSGLALTLGLVLTVLAGVNVYAGYLPDLPAVGHFLRGDDRVELGGATQQSVGGGRLHGADAHWHEISTRLDNPWLDIHQRRVIVALPPGYNTAAASAARYPVVYLFSGFPGRPVDWFAGGRVSQVVDALVSRHLMPYPILVAPDVNGGFFTDSETLDAVGGPQVETWVTRDVVDWVDGHLRTLADRGDRILVGMSSGGFAALNLGLHHMDQFGLVAGLEPYGDPGSVARRLLGGSLALLRANSPSSYVGTMPMAWRSHFFLDVGSSSATGVRRVQALAEMLAARGQLVDFRIETGRGSGHTWVEATQGLPYALAFAGRTLGSPELAAPVTSPGSASPSASPSAQRP